VRKIHKNVEGKFSEELTNLAKDLRYLWRENDFKSKDQHKDEKKKEKTNEQNIDETSKKD
jgi:hypothetical protein